jgi:hypothetical protein
VRNANDRPLQFDLGVFCEDEVWDYYDPLYTRALNKGEVLSIANNTFSIVSGGSPEVDRISTYAYGALYAFREPSVWAQAPSDVFGPSHTIRYVTFSWQNVRVSARGEKQLRILIGSEYITASKNK